MEDDSVIKYQAIGVTATRNGLTRAQKQRAQILMSSIRELHHGDGIGGDRDAHEIVRGFDNGARIVGHPPADDKLRAFCNCDELAEPRPYLERNREIVDASDLLIGFPKSHIEYRRSSTFATIRYAMRTKTPLLIVWPDGSFAKTLEGD